jgi:plasmid stability protein
LEKLKQRAKENNRSLEAEIRDILREATGKPSIQELLAEMDRIAAMTLPVPQTDSGVLQAEGRER